MKRTSPVVVLDSGLGGLTVVRALRKRLPHEDIVYFGDTARLPYGSKSAGTVGSFVRQIIEYLRPVHPKHVVIACNTATALAMTTTRAAFPDLTISGVVDPGGRAAAVAAGAKAEPLIGVIATEATIRSKAYERAIHRRRHHARLLMRATPLLVPIIEEGRSPDDPLVELAVRQYLAPFVKYKVDVLVLGCTHYPILRELIERHVDAGVAVIDSADMCADDVAARLRRRGLLREPDATAGPAASTSGGGTLRCFVTDDSPKFAKLSARFLGIKIDPPTLVTLDELTAASSQTVRGPLRTAG